MRCLLPFSLALLLAACPGPAAIDGGTVIDAGSTPDSGVEGPACTTSRDCKLAESEGVCRTGRCTSAALCTDDVECGLGEGCVAGACRFTGCATNADCATGTCRTDVFTCSECGTNADCPTTRPVCDGANTCVQCSSDSQCAPPGPGHCDGPTGACVHCLEDKHCPNGLACGANRVCTGAKLNALCPMGIACDSGLICVALGGVNTCLNSCALSAPACKTGEICYKLTYSGGSGLVFDQGGPLGVCYLPQTGAKGYREACSRATPSLSTSNCQPNLTCIPDSQNISLCRTFCDLNLSNACPTGEKCHPFKGDFNGRLYGLCYPDNGWGDACSKDSACKPNQSCTPYEDPSAADELAPICQFSVGAAPGLSPCKNTALADGGIFLADKVCQSGSCQADPLLSSVKFFCYSACKADGDCSVGARTGTCDGDFVFPAGAATGTVKGCRPHCTSSAGCAEYGSNIACRSRYTPGYNPSFLTTCAPFTGTGEPGAACSVNTQCRSGFCLLQDGRGSQRAGYCAEACDVAADCGLDAGSRTGPLGCAPMTFLGFQGFDGVFGSADDQLLTARICGGAGCTTDDDCAGARCVPDVDPADAGFSLALRCRPSHASAVLEGGSACNQDAECASGVCGTLQAPSTGSGKVCFQACTAATVCPGTSTCRIGGMRVAAQFATVSFDSCAP
jgi:hypothetical protein